MTNARFDDKNLSVRFTKIKLDIYKPTINLVQSSADQGGSKITIPIPQKYIYYTYNVMLPLIDLEPISSPLIIILLLWLTLFAFHKYINYSSPPKAFLDYIFNCAYLLSIYQLNNNNKAAGNDNNNKCTVQNKTAQIICDDINVNTIYRFTSTRECGITLDEIWIFLDAVAWIKKHKHNKKQSALSISEQTRQHCNKQNKKNNNKKNHLSSVKTRKRTSKQTVVRKETLSVSETALRNFTSQSLELLSDGSGEYQLFLSLCYLQIVNEKWSALSAITAREFGKKTMGFKSITEHTRLRKKLFGNLLNKIEKNKKNQRRYITNKLVIQHIHKLLQKEKKHIVDTEVNTMSIIAKAKQYINKYTIEISDSDSDEQSKLIENQMELISKQSYLSDGDNIDEDLGIISNKSYSLKEDNSKDFMQCFDDTNEYNVRNNKKKKIQSIIAAKNNVMTVKRNTNNNYNDMESHENGFDDISANANNKYDEYDEHNKNEYDEYDEYTDENESNDTEPIAPDGYKIMSNEDWNYTVDKCNGLLKDYIQLKQKYNELKGQIDASDIDLGNPKTPLNLSELGYEPEKIFKSSERNELQREIGELKQKVQMSECDKNKLQEQNEKIQMELRDLNGNHTKLKNKYTRLENDYFYLEDDYNYLRDMNNKDSRSRSRSRSRGRWHC